ncbi:ubiquitin-related domain-containing protein [Aspergillus cavernicola]|uniref:Ubiquitin-like modifier HUB1 n=1 Tax=Aspergillus cavernicola TaxID=176166 RepID=A0ABR4I5C5_9EURO
MPESPGEERRRSRSPPRRPKAQGGFRWKDKRPSNYDANNEGDARLGRGYRNRSPHQPYDRDRDQPRDRDRDRGNDRYRSDYRDRDRDQYRPRDSDRNQDRNRDQVRAHDRNPDPNQPPQAPQAPKAPKKEKKPKPQQPISSGEVMIIVHVNDRLGTKAAIPCLPSDTVGNFKALVAAHIGREPHEILLKRQGERPFKDFITLADYSIGNGVQLDLEVGTGD